MNERLGFLAHELRNQIHTASLALMAIKSGSVGVAGATGAVLERSLNNGILRVRDIPGSGCVITIDLPRHSLASPASDAPQAIV